MFLEIRFKSFQSRRSRGIKLIIIIGELINSVLEGSLIILDNIELGINRVFELLQSLGHIKLFLKNHSKGVIHLKRVGFTNVWVSSWRDFVIGGK